MNRKEVKQMKGKFVKRVTALILAAMVAVSAAACGSGRDAEGSENTDGKRIKKRHAGDDF